ncbi:MAG: filamentous hemagglutinin N-terminal domain-containing protein, partial [Candidatus Kaelpia imicola]|nr:filamentous hemagglutinin N-terminal domain-containing protein [Candidatus Kaelpia imicola]
MNTKKMGICNRFFRILFAALFLQYMALPPTPVYAEGLPTGISDQIGSSTVTVEGDAMTHTTGDMKYWGDAESFDIGVNNTLNSIGPNAGAVMLYNVTGDAGSSLAGVWNSNCNQFLLNPNGILFTETAQLNLGGLVASTLSMTKEDFLSGSYVLSGADVVTLGNNIINEGAIETTNPFGVTFASGAIRNTGSIKANLGVVNMISGKGVTLNVAGDGSIQAAVSQDLLNNVYDSDGRRVAVGVDNVGTIQADGGEIRIEVGAVQDVFDTLINQEGVVRAGSLVEKNGKIVLISDDEGIIQNTGTITASAIEDGADGGTIEMRGSKVGQFGEVRVDALGEGDGGSITLYANDVVALSSGSITTANANVDGSGGEIIVYSPETALFWQNARIEAKGGSASGDGGFVEVSGKEHIEIYGIVDASAANGSSGLFYMDPTDVTLSDATVGMDNSPTWDPIAVDPNTGTINVATIVTSLEAGTSVSVDTFDDNAGGGTGRIIVANAISVDLSAAGGLTVEAPTLTLNAQDDIDINASIGVSATDAGGDLLNLTLNATNGVDVGANITDLSGGTFTSIGTTFNNTGGAITTGGGAVDLSGHTGAITIGAAINAGAGTFHSHGTNFNNTDGIITTTDTSATAVQINNTGIVTIGANILSSGEITIDSASSVSVAAAATGNTCTNLDIDTTGAFAATGGSKITGGGDGTDLNINAAGIALDGTAGGQLINTAGGKITLVSTGANSVFLENDSINNATGLVSLTSAGQIRGSTFGGNDGIAEIDADGNVTFSANGTGNPAQLEITGDGSGDSTLTITNTGANNVDIQELTNQFNQVTITQQNASSWIDIDFSDADLVDIDGAIIENLVLSNGDVGFTYSLTPVAALNVCGTAFTTGATSAVSITANGVITQTSAVTVNGGGVTFAAGAANDITLSNANNDFIGAVAVTTGDDVTLRDVNAIILGASTISGNLAVTSSGNITDNGSALSVTGTTTLIPGAGNSIILDTAGNNFTGAVSVTNGTDATFVDTNALAMGTTSITGVLTLTAGGNITDSGVITAGTLTTTNATGSTILDQNNIISNLGATITSIGGNFELTNTTPLALTDITATGHDITIDNTGNAVTFNTGSNIAANNFTVTASAITTLNNSDLSAVATSTTLQPNAAGTAIGLAGGAGAFSLDASEITVLKASGGSVVIGRVAGATGALTLGADVDLAGKTATIYSGRINDASNTISADTLTLILSSTAAGGNTVKTNVATLAADTTGGTATADRALIVTETDGVALSTITLNDGALNVTTSGAVTTSGVITTTGITTIAAGAGNNITLNNADNDFSTVAITTGNDVTLRDTNAIVLGASTISGALDVTSSGSITDNGGALVVTGTTTLAPGAGSSIVLNTATNDFTGVVSITNGINATLVDVDDITLGAMAITGTLNITAGAAIADDLIQATLVNASSLIMTAATSIGAAGDGDIDTTSVTSLTVDANDDIYVDGDSQLASLTITLDPNGAATYDLTNFTNLTENITTDGTNLTIAQLDTSTATAMSLTADTGNIAVTSFDSVTTGTLNLTASSGNIAVGEIGIATGSGDVTLSASGTITDSNANVNTNITTTGAVSLTGLTGIGISGGDAVDIASATALTIDTNGYFSVIGTGGGLTLTDLTITLDTAGAGVYSLTGINNNTLTLVDDVGNLTLTAFNNIGTTNLSLTNDTGNITVASFDTTGAGTLSLTASSGNIILTNAADTMVTGSGAVSVTASGTINDTADAAGNAVTTTGTLTLDSNSTIGASGNYLDVEVDGLTVDSQGIAYIRNNVAADTTLYIDTNNTDYHYIQPTNNILINRVDAGTADVYITATAGSVLDHASDSTVDIIGDDLTIIISSGVYDIGASGNALDTQVTNIYTLSTANGDIYINETDSGVTQTGGAGISAVGSDVNITVAGPYTASTAISAGTTGTITIDVNDNVADDGVFTTNAAGTLTAGSGSGGITITADGGVTLGLAAVTTDGAISIDADNDSNNIGTFTSNATGTLTAGTGGNITITAADVSIDGAITGTGTVTLQPKTAGRTIGIGGGAGSFALSDAEILELTDGFSSIVIGRADTNADITVGAIAFTDSVTIQAPSGGSITQTGVLTAPSLTLDAATAIAFTQANDVDTLSITTTNDIIQFTDADGVDISTLNSGSAASTITAGDAVTDSGSITAATLTVKTLKDGGAAIELDEAGNDVNNLTLQARNTLDNAYAAGAITFVDTDGINITTVGTTSTVTITAGDVVSDMGTGTILGSTLTVKTTNNAGSAINLSSATNDVDTVDLRARNAADGDYAAGAVTFRDLDGFAISNIGTASTVTLTAGGAITGSADDNTTDVLGSGLTVAAATGFGASGSAIDLDTTTSDITASGDVYFDVVGSGGHGATVDVTSGNIVIDGRNTANGAGYEVITLTDVDTDAGYITVDNYGNNIVATLVDAAGATNDVTMTTYSSGDVQVDSVTATDQIIIVAVDAISESGADGGADLTAADLLLTAADGIGSGAAIETAATNLSARNTTTNNIEITNTGDLTLDDLLTGSESVDNDAGDVIISAASALDITDPVTGVNVYLAATEAVNIAANITSTNGNIGIRADSNGGGTDTDDLTYTSGTISATGGYVLLMGDDVTLDVADDGIQTGGITATGASSVTPPNDNFGIAILAQDNVVVNTTLTTTNSSGSVIIGADGDFRDLAGLPDAILQTDGVAPSGTGNVTFNSDADTGTDTLGAAVTAEDGISITGINITVDQVGVAFDADGSIARAGTAVGTPVLHAAAGFAALAAENIDTNPTTGTTTINTVGGSSDVIITADYDFGAITAPGDTQDMAIPIIAASTAGTFDIDNTTITSGDGITLSAPGAMTLNTLSAPGDISATSTASSVSVIASSIVTAGTDGTGSLTLTADTLIDIGAAAAITTGTDVNFNANTAGDNVARTITVGDSATIAAGIDNNWSASDAITVDGEISQGGLLNIATGEAGDDNNEGSFILSDDGVITTNGSLIIGAASVLDNIQIINADHDDATADSLTIAGVINAAGDVTADFETDTVEGDINFTGSILADDDVTLVTYDTGLTYDIEGSGTIVADAITLTTADIGASITVNDLTAREWILVTAGENITTGNLSAQSETGGYAIKLNNTGSDATITVNGTTTANAIADLDVYLDPATVTINGNVDITGNYDAWATGDINVNADIYTSGGRIVLLADDDGSAVPVGGVHDGTGDLTMGVGTSLRAVDTTNGDITLQGEAVTLYDVTAGDDLTIESDADGAGGAGDVTLNGIIRGNPVAIDANTGAVYVNADPNNIAGAFTISAASETVFLNADLKTAGLLTITPAVTIRTDSTLSGDLNGTGGGVTISGAVNSDNAVDNHLIISTGNGAVSLQAVGTGTSLNKLTVTTTGETAIHGDITTSSGGIDLSTASDVDIDGVRTLTTTSGDISLMGGAVDAETDTDDTLTVTTSAGGDVYIDNVGTGSNLGGVTVNLNGGGALTLYGTIETGAATGIVFTSAPTVVLADNVSLDSNGAVDGPIALDGGTISGAGRTLTLDSGTADISLGTPTGTATLGTLTTTLADELNLEGTLTVSGDLTFANVATNVELTGSGDTVTINVASDSTFTTGGTAITDLVASQSNLIINANTGTTALDAVGTEAQELASLTISGTGATTLNGSIYADAVTMSGITGGVTVDEDITIDINNAAGDLTFDNTPLTLAAGDNLTITGAANSDTTLYTVADTGSDSTLDINSAGTLTLKGDVGTSAVELGTLAVDGQTGSTYVSGGVTIYTEDAAVSFANSAIEGTTAGVDSLTIDAEAQAITLSTVGANTRLDALTLTTTNAGAAAITLNGNITADAVNVTDGNITLGASLIIDGDDAAGDISLNQTIAGAALNLTVNASAGDEVTLGALTTSGILTLNTAGSVTLAGVQDLGTLTTTEVGGDLNISANLTTDNAIDLTNVNRVDITAGAATVAIEVQTNAQAFDTGGTPIVDTGSDSALTITTNAGAISLDNVGQGGDVLTGLTLDSSAQTTLSGNIATTTTGIDLSSAANVDLASNVTLSSTTGAILVNGTAVDGAFNLDIESTSGAVTLGALGANVNMQDISVDTTSTTTLSGNITATGDVDLSAASGGITISAPRTITSSGGNINLGSTVARTAATDDLTLTSTLGSVTVTAIGAAANRLDTVTIASATGTTLNGSIYTDGYDGATSGDVSITGGSIVVGSSLTIDTDLATSADNDIAGSITLGNIDGGSAGLTLTLDASSADALTVDVINGGAVTIGTVGSSQSISLTPSTQAQGVGTSGVLTLNGNITSPTLDVSGIYGQVTLGDDVSILTTATAVNFGNASGIDGTSAGQQGISIATGIGPVTLPRIGSTVDPEYITVANITGAITLGANIDATQDITLGTGDITLTADVNITSLYGDVVLTGDIDGNGNAPTISGVSISAQNIDTTGDSDEAGGNVSLTSTGGDINYVGTITTTGGTDVDNSGGNAAGTVTIASGADFVGGAIITTGGAAGGGDTVGGAAGAISIIADTATLSGNLTATGGNEAGAGAGGAGANITLETDLVLAESATLTFNTQGRDAAGAGATGADGDFSITGTIDGTGDVDETLTVSTRSGAITLGGAVGSSVALATLDLNTTGTASLGGSITATNINLDGLTGGITLTDDATYRSTNTAINLSGGTITGDYDLVIIAGTGNDADVTLAAVDVNSLDISAVGNGTTTLNGAITTDEGADLSSATDVNIAADITFTNTESGTVDLSGGAVDGAFDISIVANATDVALGAMGQGTPLGTAAGADTALTVSSTGTTTLSGNITTIDTTGVSFTSATNVVLGSDVVIDTGANAGNVSFSNAAANSLSGGFDLSIDAGTGNVTFDNITQLTSLTVDNGASGVGASAVTFNGAVDMPGTVTVYAGAGGSNITLGSADSIAAGTILLNTVLANADGDIVIDGNISTTGNNTITLTSDNDINIGQANAASITGVNGEVDLTTENVILLGSAGNVGTIVTTGTGVIDINNGGALTMGTSEDTKISGGGGVNISGASSIANEVVGTNSDVVFVGAVTLVANTIVGSANESVSFNSTVDGGYTLTTNANNGTATYGGAVGTGTSLTGLTTTAGIISAGAITTTGAANT